MKCCKSTGQGEVPFNLVKASWRREPLSEALEESIT